MAYKEETDYKRMTAHLIQLIIALAIPYALGALTGFVAGWQTFRVRFYQPLKHKLKVAMEGWQETIDRSRAMVEQWKKQAPDTEQGLILSPIQVRFPGQRRDEEDHES